MEPFKSRLSRFLSDPQEVPLTILNSVANFFLPEIEAAVERRLPSLLMLGTHAVMQIVGGGLLGLRPRDGTRYFLREYVDGDAEHDRFSLIGDELHAYRNIVAHRWFSKTGHQIREDWGAQDGWRRDGDVLILNPGTYGRRFVAAFRGTDRLYGLPERMSSSQLRVAQLRFLRDWLELESGDPLARDIVALQDAPEEDVENRAASIVAEIRRRYLAPL